MTETMTRKQAATAAGCHMETLRYYERIGLMAPPMRSANGYRQYDAGEVSRLAFIVRARDLGFSTEEIRRLLDLASDRQACCGDVRSLAADHLADVERRIAGLQRVADTLRTMLAACRDDAAPMPDCPIIEALSEA